MIHFNRLAPTNNTSINAVIDGGIIIYAFNTLSGQVRSVQIADETAPASMLVESGAGYRFGALGTLFVSSPGYMDFNAFQCGVGLSGGNELVNVGGADMEIDLTINSSQCVNPIFAASGFRDASGNLGTLTFETCSDISAVSTYGSSCPAGNLGSALVQMLSNPSGAPQVVFFSRCLNIASSDSIKIPVGDGAFPFHTRVVGFASVSDCSSGAQNYEFAEGLINPEEADKAKIYDNGSGAARVFLED